MSSRRPFLKGALCAVVVLLAARWAINESTIPDWLVSPLLIEDTSGRADALVVLGAGVVGDCGVNLNGVRRVLLAARVWREQQASAMIFTGSSDVPSCPVSLAMARLAHEIGVPESSVHIETSSRTTRENAALSALLLRRLGASRVRVVTDRLHMRRAAGVFAQLGFDVERSSVPIYEGHTDNVSMLAAGLRESAAVLYYRARGWIESGTVAHAAPAESQPIAPGGEMHISSPTGPIVVLGASYAGGWQPENLARIPVINRGVAGQQSFEMLERFERDVVAAKPRAVILWGFINDIFRAEGELDAAVARVRESYTKMIALARQHGIEPIVATEVTIRPERSWTNGLAAIVGALRGKESYQARINRHVIDTNRWLVDVARQEGLMLLDFQSTLAEEGGMRRPEFTDADGSHITEAGYAALTTYATPLFERHVASER